MIGGEDVRCPLIPVEVFDDLSDFLNALIDDLDIMEVLLGIRPVGMTGGVQTQKMKKEDQPILV